MKKLASISLALLLALALVPTTSQTVDAQEEITGELTGNIGVASKYIFRGVMESDVPAIQGGIDYSHPSGVYAGYWGSTLDYGGGSSVGTSTENDVYAGYAGSAGAVSYDVALTQYTYLNDPGSAGLTEANFSAGVGPVSLGVNYALNDGFADEGDIYTSLSYSKSIPFGFDFSSKIGYYSLDDESGAATDSGWGDIVVGVSHPIGDSPASMGLQYVATNTSNASDPGPFGSPTNMGQPTQTENQVVMTLSYGFGIAE